GRGRRAVDGDASARAAVIGAAARGRAGAARDGAELVLGRRAVRAISLVRGGRLRSPAVARVWADRLSDLTQCQRAIGSKRSTAKAARGIRLRPKSIECAGSVTC